MKVFSDSDERWIVRQVKANSRLCVPNFATGIEKYLQKIVNLELLALSWENTSVKSEKQKKPSLVLKMYEVCQRTFE